MCFEKRNALPLDEWIEELTLRDSIKAKIEFLESVACVQSFMLLPHYQKLYQMLVQPEQRHIFLILIALGAGELFFDPGKQTKPLAYLEEKLGLFIEVEKEFQNIGGLLGYVRLMRELLLYPKKELPETFRAPHFENIEGEGNKIQESSAIGIAGLKKTALLVVAGGLGSRLGLADEKGEPLPVAYLPFMGRSLLEGIIRDLEGLEHLYFTTYGEPLVIPLALMTSKEQNNQAYLLSLFEKHHFFGRPKESVHFFSQLSVPVMTIQGTFSSTGPAEFLFHPSGHGALWKSAEESGILQGLEEQGIEHVLLRQINNPLAALNHNLLAFLGFAIRQQKSFGFLACERIPGAAEGALVDKHESGEHWITNIEYTHLDHGTVKGLANTNLLYARLKEIRKRVKERNLFGPIVNMKSEVPCYKPTGHIEKVKGGRLESMMQNISEHFTAKEGRPLPTLVAKGARAHVMAAIKRLYDPEGSPLETPEAAHYALLQNSYALLQRCTSESLAPFVSLEQYLEKGPNYSFTYHPILGPLYSLIEKKLQCKRIAESASIQLEIADFSSHELEVEGALRIEGVKGKVRLDHVCIKNRGIDWQKSRPFWQEKWVVRESCTIVVGDGGELVIENVILSGNQRIEVLPGESMLLTQNAQGELVKNSAHSLLNQKKQSDK